MTPPAPRLAGRSGPLLAGLLFRFCAWRLARAERRFDRWQLRLLRVEDRLRLQRWSRL